MIDLGTVPHDVLIARGMYSTVRSGHESAKKALATQCNDLMYLAPKILKDGQSNDAGEIDGAIAKIDAARNVLDMAEANLVEMKTLAIQRAELKAKAWTA